MRIWFRRKVQIRLCEMCVEHELSNQGHTARRSFASKMAGFRRQREGLELSETLELVQARVPDDAFQNLQHDLRVVRRLMDKRLPRNDSIWIHSLGQHTDRELPAQAHCVQRMQLLLHNCLPPLLRLPQAEEVATMAADGFYRDFLRQTWPFLDQAGRRKFVRWFGRMSGLPASHPEHHDPAQDTLMQPQDSGAGSSTDPPGH